MTSEKLDEKAIFNVARKIESPEARAEYLHQVCGPDGNLIERVETLLRGYEEQASFLESPPSDLTPTTDQSPIAERPGTVIGPYKLLQQIGEGGMGVVFMAEQTEPIQRTVAFKIIKPGMDTRQVIARFEAERQAVAMMDHPNIAKVLDAGTTNSGRPYFVMELVKGVPITKYCDEKRLPLPARLELFIQVCQAVQHAHQKGIIHRDIKPNNVLVAEYDQHAIPKVIDFGVAKATAQKLTERTMFTEFGQVLGTMEYMSPEQSKFNQLDIDTRSDIYSLGVLLYELLTGSTPFEGKRLHEAAFDEMLRIIREEEPPKPSNRITSIDTLPSVAANRHTEPARLSKDVRGELDWIVMKALEKDRKRRYQTASGFAADIERHLHDEPVDAAPPSAAYRFRRFARRYRAFFAAALLIFASLVCGIAVSTWQAVRATRAEQQAVSERDAKDTARREAVTNALHARAVSGFLVNALRSTSPLRNGRAVTIAEVLDQAANEVHEKLHDDPLTEGALLHAIGESYRALALYEEAIKHLEKARQLRLRTLGRQHQETFRCVRDLGWAYIIADRPDQALPLFDESFRLAKARLGQRDPVTLECAYDLAVCYFELGRQDDSLKLIEETFELQQATLGRHHTDTVESMFVLARNYSWAGRSDEATKLYQEVIQLSATHLDSVVRLLEMEAKEDLAREYAKLGRLDEAQLLIDESVKLFEKWIGPEHRGTRHAREGLASIYADLIQVLANSDDIQKRDPSRALQLAKRAVEVDPQPWRAMQNLGSAEYRMGNWQASVEALQESCEQSADGAGSAFQWFFLAMAHWQLGEQDEARHWYGRAIEGMKKQQTDDQQLRRFRAEAEELLKVTDKNPMANPPVEMK